MTKRGYILTSFQDWDDANRSENVLMHGPDMDLEARDLTSQEVNNLFLQARSDDSVGLESEQSDATGFSEVVHPPTEDCRSRAVRQEMVLRLMRRNAERDSGNLLLALVGGSPLARDQQIADLMDRLNGLPEELSRERAALRREAARLAPHNLTELIRLPPSRGRG